MLSPRQAATEISEDQLLNFLVNRLTDAFNVELAANAELGPEDLFEVLVGACADGTSVSSLCDRSEESPHANTVSYHLREQFDLDCLSRGLYERSEIFELQSALSAVDPVDIVILKSLY